MDSASIKPFPQFDIRLGSSKRLVAYWTTVAHRIRMEGSGILALLKALEQFDSPQKR